jgi:hypothetical protein
LKTRLLFALFFIPLLLTAGVRYYVLRHRAAQTEKIKQPPPETQPSPEPIRHEEPQAVAAGVLRISDDASLKAGSFWLEQTVELTNAAPAADGSIVSLYVSVDPDTMAGVRLRINSDAAILEQTSGNDQATVLNSAVFSKVAPGEHVLGALWRHNELSFWMDSKQILAWSPQGSPPALEKPSATLVKAAGVKLGARRTLALGAIRFDDDFMRESGNGVWRPLSGRWELTGMAFPERSANPFSLRASFGNERPADDTLYKGRFRPEQEYSPGFVISPMEGTLHIARISGGSPAARAGLQEDDIFIEIDGRPVDEMNPWAAHQLLQGGGYGRPLRLKILRPGEKKLRSFTITPETFRWATPSEGMPIQPVTTPTVLDGDAFSLIAAGEHGWSDYAAEVAVKALGAGGMGLAVAMTSPRDYVMFRWRGPAGRKAENLPASEKSIFDRMELVRAVDGKETVLAECPAAYRSYEFYRMGVDWNGEDIVCTIDGNKMLSAKVPGLKRGQLGLCALRGDPVFFDDVHVASDRAALSSTHAHERKLNDIFIFEDDMEVWANPALEWQRDPSSEWAVHRGRFPGDQAVVLNKPRFNDLTVALFSQDDPARTAGGKFTIKDGVARLEGINWETAEQKVGPGPFQRISIRAADADAAADIDGVQLKAVAKAGRNSAPFLGANSLDRIAIRGLKNIGDPKTVRVMASNTLEYTFDTSPTDWKVESGRWGLLNKWICDPRWSWFGGRTKTLAALWSKFIFSGDITVDAHVALMMQKEDPPYERPGDYNMAICGDGVNLDSGYTLIFGGDSNSWTRLYRKGKLVAESWNEDHRVFSDKIQHPDKPELHQRWFHLKLEKIGATLKFYRDDNLAFTFTDPDPLGDGRTAFWTLDNGFLLSRVRIAHGGVKLAPFESRRSGLFEDSRVINQYDGEVFTAVEPQTLPRAIQDALSAPPEAFVPAAADVIAAAAGHEDEGATRAYRVSNGTGGGPFALQWKNVMVDPESKGILRFAYRIEPGAQVDLYLLDINGIAENPNFNVRYKGAYRWRMTGPKESNEFAPLVGEIPGVVADGRWHAIQFDLQPSWRDMWQRRGFSRLNTRYLLRPFIGNLDNTGYLLAGMNGNHVGASYSITDIATYSPRDVDTKAPKVKRVIWPFDKDGDGRSVVIVFDDAAGSGVREDSLSVNLNGVAIPLETMEFDFIKQTLRIDLIKTGLPALTQIPALTLKLLGFQDRAQNPSLGGFNETWTYNAADALVAAKPVAAPAISCSVAGAVDQVPSDAALWAFNVTHAGPPVPRLQESTDAPPWAPYGQRHSVQVVNPHDGTSFGFRMGGVSYSLRRYPYLQIDYKMSSETPLNLHFNDAMNQLHALYLTDLGDARDPFTNNIASHCGPPADFITDGTWRECTIPIEKLLDSAKPETEVTEISNLSLHDHGWRGNRRGQEYWVHRILPVPAGRNGDLSFNWSAQDITGITDYATSIDGKPQSDPDGKKEITPNETLAAALQRSSRTLQDGWNYLHVRVKNGAGIWSETAHRKFYLDNTPPKVVKTVPANGLRFAGQAVEVAFEDANGIDPSSLRLTVNGRPFGPFGRGISFDKQKQTLTFNAVQAGVTFPDGSDVAFSIDSIADRVGNAITAPFQLAFHIDHSLEKNGPVIARMGLAPTSARAHRQIEMETSFQLDFEEHLGHVHAMRDCKLDWIDNPQEACLGRRAIKITALSDDADVQVMLHKNSWYIDRLPVLQFDYKIDPGMKVDLLMEVVGQWHCIQFTGDGKAPEGGKRLGQIEAVIPDGKWQHASVDLRKLINDAGLTLPVRIVNKIILSTQGCDGCKRGSALYFDNLNLCADGGGESIEWEPEPHASGVAGYSFAIDENPNTIPNATINYNANGFACDGYRGVHYVHVRACDHAGNWGPTRTMRVDFGDR